MESWESRSIDESDLIRRTLNGDRGAFEAIVTRYRNDVYWIAVRMVGPQDAEDITQEVFMRAYEAIAEFRGDSSIRTWLSRIAYNLCISLIRRRDRRGEQLSLGELSDEQVYHLRLFNESNVNEVTILANKELVEAAISTLPARYRAILTFYYVEGLKYKEIAQIMAMPIGTVKTHLHRARLMLRDRMFELGSGTGERRVAKDREG